MRNSDDYSDDLSLHKMNTTQQIHCIHAWASPLQKKDLDHSLSIVSKTWHHSVLSAIMAGPFGSQTVVKVSRLLAPLVSLMTQRALCVVTELFLYVIIR